MIPMFAISANRKLRLNGAVAVENSPMETKKVPGAVSPCGDADRPVILEIINDGAMAYKGIIPADRWHEPYMSVEQLGREISLGVKFWKYLEAGSCLGVMGIQDVKDVTLIRHAYVRTSCRNRGIGGCLLGSLLSLARRPVLIGEAHGKNAFGLSGFMRNTGSTYFRKRKEQMLRGCILEYPDWQVETVRSSRKTGSRDIR
jgi:GNAT superfamily N-acetyltransferase